MSEDLKKIVWLASYPKSGNTWFRIFLANFLNDKETNLTINEINSSTIASSRPLFDKYTGVSSSDLTNDEILELRPDVYCSLAKESEKDIFIKVHDKWGKTKSGKPVFPAEITKGSIYFIRNPLDVAISFSYHLNLDIDIVIEKMSNSKNSFCFKKNKLHSQLEQSLADWSGHVSSWTVESGLPSIILRYEDMLNDTFNTFKSALTFLNIQAEDENISLAIKRSDFNVLSSQEKDIGFMEKPMKMKQFFRTGKAGEGQRILSKQQIERLQKDHFKVMEKFAYLHEI